VDFISDIIHQFGFPHMMITDLVSNFTLQSFGDFCDNSCIEVKYTSVAHPRANGQVERINGLILGGLKKRESMMPIPRRVASRSKSYLIWSGGCELNPTKLLDNLLSSLHMDQKPYCLHT
jgi:hypothetical protein